MNTTTSKEDTVHNVSEPIPSSYPDSEHIQLCSSIQDMQNFAHHFLERSPYTIQKKEHDSILVLLYGKVGAGKSTFVRLCLKLLELCEMYQFSSPSFSLAHEYPIPSKTVHNTSTTDFVTKTNSMLHNIHNIVHIDLYRLHSIDELYDIDLFTETHSLFFVEWPDTVPFQFFEYLHIPIINMYFNIIDEHTRSIMCSPSITMNRTVQS